MALTVCQNADQGWIVEAALLNVDGVAELLNCSSRTVRRLADSGLMPRPIRVSSLVRWRRDDVDRWIKDGCPPLKERGGHTK